MTSEQLDRIERALGFGLPAEYKELMLRHPLNGKDEEDLMLSNCIQASFSTRLFNHTLYQQKKVRPLWSALPLHLS